MDFKEKDPPATDAAALDPLRAPTMWAVTEMGGDGAATLFPRGGLPSVTFDVCHVGVVLRVVLGVLGVLLLGAMYGSAGPQDWVLRWALACAAGLPGCLLWVVGVCGARRWLGRLPVGGQWTAVALWGAISGAYGQAQLRAVDWWLGTSMWSAWELAAPAAVGAAMAAVCLWWLRQRLARVDPALTQARLVELQARIRPHFLFNTLNTAIALVQLDPARAEAVLEDLAELFRRALSSPGTRSTLGEEVDLARRYLGIEQLRFGERLTVAWRVPDDALHAAVPALLLQPLVENAVRHGVEADPDGGWIRVEAQRKGDRLTVLVSNSVPAAGDSASAGATRAAGHGIALRNVRYRLLLMHDVESGFEAGLRPVAPGDPRQCYVVRLTIPMGAPDDEHASADRPAGG